MAAGTLQGVVPILVTLFDEQGRIDTDSLQSLIDFDIAARVHGLGVAPGDEAGARKVFEATIVPVNRLGAQGGDLFYHLHKQLLVKLGVIRTARVRGPTTTVDPVSQREIDELLEQLVPAVRAA